MHNNNIIFAGNLFKIDLTTYSNKDGQQHNAVSLLLVSDERIAQSLMLKVRGSIGDQLAALNPRPGLCSMVAYIEFHTFDYNGRTCQEIRAWKLEVTMLDTGQLYVITSANSKTDHTAS